MTRRLLILFLAAATGYISLSQEMIWMRAVAYMTGDLPSVFAHVLGAFLIGVALGALWAQRLCAGRFASPAHSPLRFIGVMLLLSAIFYSISIAAVAELLTHSATLGMLATYVVVAIVSFLLGGIFPILCHASARVGQSVGLAVSRLYLANIIGSTLGPLFTGFVLMQYLSTSGIVLLLSLGTLILGMLTIVLDVGSNRRGAPLGAVANAAMLPGQLIAALAVVMILPLHHRLYGGLLEKLQFQSRYYPGLSYKYLTENRSGIIAVVADPSGQADMLYGGGMYDGNFNVDPILNPNGIDRAYMIAGLHPDPHDVLEIGLASGSWSRVIAAYGPVQRHTIVEINPDYLKLVQEYSPQKDLLTDPKVKIVIDDGRRWLGRNPGAIFDLIVQNTTWHWRSHATNLLSADYFRQVKQHLKPGGIFYFNTTHSDDAAYTAAQVFKHVVRYAWFIAASDSPFTLQPQEIRANLMRFEFGGKAMFDSNDPDFRQFADKLANQPLTDIAPALRARSDLRCITDDNMATEYKGQRWYDPAKSWGALFRRTQR